jgi:hypothetical protein
VAEQGSGGKEVHRIRGKTPLVSGWHLLERFWPQTCHRLAPTPSCGRLIKDRRMGKILRQITSGIERLSRVSEILAEAALAGLLLLVSHEVFVRYVLDRPTIFSVEISEYLLVFLAFMSIGWVLRRIATYECWHWSTSYPGRFN